MSDSQVPRRAMVAVGLSGVGLIHVLDLPGKWAETRWMAFGYAALVLACVAGAEFVLRSTSRLAWAVGATLPLAPAAGFILTRTVGLPGARDDLGNWLEPLGLASLFVEFVTVALAVGAVVGHRVPRVSESGDVVWAEVVGLDELSAGGVSADEASLEDALLEAALDEAVFDDALRPAPTTDAEPDVASEATWSGDSRVGASSTQRVLPKRSTIRASAAQDAAWESAEREAGTSRTSEGPRHQRHG